MSKSNSIITPEHSGYVITFTVAGAGSIALDLSKLSDAVKDRALVHGLIQRVSDAAALSRDTVTGQPASPADKLASMTRVVEHYNSGTSEWALRTASGETGEGSLIIRALAEVQGQSVDVMRESVNRLAEKRGITVKALLRKLAQQPDVARKMADLRPKSTIDADDLLGELS